MSRAALPLVLLAALLSACAASTTAARLPDVPLEAPDARVESAADLARGARFTVLEFFSAGCSCQKAHDARLVALAARYAPRGVRFYAVDSELDATPTKDAAEARRRGYPFPILVDRSARLAHALGAEYATYVVVVDGEGEVRFRGGIDSDRTHLRDDASPWLADALDDLLAGKPVRRAEAKALGCALMVR